MFNTRDQERFIISFSGPKMASPAYSVPLKNDYNAVEQEGQAYSTIVTNQARVMLELIAPANLPEGYNLQVESSGERYSVIVVSQK
jgi:hypothetical protein